MLVKIYLAVGTLICLWFAVAAARGWKGPDFGGGSYGRGGVGSYHGSGWLGGK